MPKRVLRGASGPANRNGSVPSPMRSGAARAGASEASGFRRGAGVAAALFAAALALPATASAHGLIQRANLPIPEWLFGWAAAIVLIVSFLALGVLWSAPRLEGTDAW